MRVVTIGGGKGQNNLIAGLKKLRQIRKITAIVNAVDRGGGTGEIRKHCKLGGYIGDGGRVVLAGSTPPHGLSKRKQRLWKFAMDGLFYRFPNGFISDQTVRNVVITGIQKANNLSPTVALQAFSVLADAHRRIETIPITDQNVDVRYFLPNDLEVDGEHNLDTMGSNRLYDSKLHFVEGIKIISSKEYHQASRSHYRRKVFADDAMRKRYRRTRIAASPLCIEAIGKADVIVIAMGDLFTSVLPPLCFSGMKKAFRKCKAKIVVMLNIMTKVGETDSFNALDFLAQIEDRLGRKADAIVANNSIPPGTKDVLEDYEIMENKVKLPADAFAHRHRFIVAPLAHLKDKTLQHDPDLVADIFKTRIIPGVQST